MGKNDFDIDFDFNEEYGFDPKAFLGTEEYDENIDLDAFSDEELGLPPTGQETEDDGFDADAADQRAAYCQHQRDGAGRGGPAHGGQARRRRMGHAGCAHPICL